ncbi:hypothetical protein R3P38DRAFT_3246212 [Favolaschia claudopus]|uniref:Uncharacterized protein n=1 Tax=Favolaschia claudopus TaxID=2862362 RepID=A0AAV9YZD4_9AGAR
MPPSTRVTVESVPDESEFQSSIAELGLPFADNGLDDLDLLHEGRSQCKPATGNHTQPLSPSPFSPDASQVDMSDSSTNTGSKVKTSYQALA